MKQTNFKTWSTVLVSLTVLLAGKAQADWITTPFSGPNVRTEGFEQLNGQPNVATYTPSYVGAQEIYLWPGNSATITSPFNLLSGLSISQPIPNRRGTSNVNPFFIVGDFSVGVGPAAPIFSLGSNGIIGSNSNLPSPSPSNNSYLGVRAPNPGGYSVTFLLPSRTLRAGAYVNATGGANITIEAFSDNNLTQSLGTYTIPSVSLNQQGVNLWSSNFLGWQNLPTGIRAIRFTGTYLVVDNFLFEVPQPSSMLLASLGMVVLYFNRKRSGTQSFTA